MDTIAMVIGYTVMAAGTLYFSGVIWVMGGYLYVSRSLQVKSGKLGF